MQRLKPLKWITHWPLTPRILTVKGKCLSMITWPMITFCCIRLYSISRLQIHSQDELGSGGKKKKLLWVKQSITPFSLVCRWQVTPYAPLWRCRCHQLHGSSDWRTQVLSPHPLQPASALHLRCACAPLTPQLLVQQCTPGLPPPPPVHEQEDRECTVKVMTCGRPVSVSCYPLMQVNIQVYGASSA